MPGQKLELQTWNLEAMPCLDKLQVKRKTGLGDEHHSGRNFKLTVLGPGTCISYVCGINFQLTRHLTRMLCVTLVPNFSFGTDSDRWQLFFG